jgi:DNA-binding NarL/FixJ family response regulator
VVICDDQDLVRDGLRAILSTVSGIEVVGEASDADHALALVEAHSPEVMLMDLKMPGTNGVTATRKITNRFADVRVLVLTTYDAAEWVDEAIKAEAAGYLLKDAPRHLVIESIKGNRSGTHPRRPGCGRGAFDRSLRRPVRSPTPPISRV